MNNCLIKDCNNTILTFKSGLCRKHYLRKYKYGNINYKIKNSPNSGREQECLYCKKLFYVPIWEDERCKNRQRKYCSKKCWDLDRIIFKNCIFCNKEIKIQKYYLKRRPNSNYFCNKKCHIEYQKCLIGNKNPIYKGISVEDQRQRKIDEYNKWRINVYERDNYTCQRCFNYGGKLNAHHILFWKDFPIFRFDIDNGITLCKDCHKYIHKIKSKSYLKRQLNEKININNSFNYISNITLC